MLTSDSNFLLNSKFYTKDNEVNVDIDYRSKEGTMKFKTISLESFITFLKKFNSTDTVLTDTGFLANNLVRKVDTVNSTHYFFFYDKISSTFSSTYSKDVIDFYEKDRIPYIGSKIVITYDLFVLLYILLIRYTNIGECSDGLLLTIHYILAGIFIALIWYVKKKCKITD